MNRLEYYFDAMKSAIQKRNKSICIADKAEGGWKAVNEYMPDDLTENSRNIKKLEATKESHKRQWSYHHLNKQNSNTTSNDKIATSQYKQRFRSTKYQIDLWFSCGKFGISASNHFVKSVRIRSFSGSYFPAFRLNKDRYGVSVYIQFECGEIRTRTTRNTDKFHTVNATPNINHIPTLSNTNQQQYQHISGFQSQEPYRCHSKV